jgi:hypothetical protein
MDDHKTGYLKEFEKETSTEGQQKTRKVCGFPTPKGPCPGNVVKGSSDQRCLFHSQDPKVRQALIEGRMKGCRQPERRKRLSLRNTGVSYIKDVNDLVRWVNFLNRKYFMREMNAEDIQVALSIAGGLGKLFEIRDVTKEIEELQEEIESLKEGENDDKDKTFSTLFDKETE